MLDSVTMESNQFNFRLRIQKFKNNEVSRNIEDAKLELKNNIKTGDRW